MMYKDKSKERDNRRDNMRRYRGRKAITGAKGITKDGVPYVESSIKGMPIYPEGVTKLEGKGVTPDIILKLTEPWWRDRLTKICKAFDHSHHPEYKEDCWLGDTNLSLACDWLACLK